MQNKKKVVVLDTNILLSDASCIDHFENDDIVIPIKVLEEIDKHKRRMDGVGSNARTVTRKLDDLRLLGNLQEGISLGKGLGTLKVSPCFPALLPEGMSRSDADNEILSVVIKESNERDGNAYFVTHDINLRVRCDSLGLKSELYSEEEVVSDIKNLYSGFQKVIVDDQIVEEFYVGEKVIPEQAWGSFCPHEFLMLTSSENNKKTALAKFISYKKPLEKLNQYSKGILKGKVKPRNKEQQYALNLLMDPDIFIVTLSGVAGTGKSLCALAAALEQTIDPSSLNFFDDPVSESEKKKKEKPKYDKILVSRSVVPMGKDIGFLPGSKSEKMSPWLGPVTDNLEYLLKERKTIEEYEESGLLEIEALTYIRGRSIAQAFIIIEEAQNLTRHEIKTIISRLGEGSKIVLVGDVEQIDNPYVDAKTNGFSYAIEKLKDSDITGHVSLIKGERSKAATLAAKVL